MNEICMFVVYPLSSHDSFFVIFFLACLPPSIFLFVIGVSLVNLSFDHMRKSFGP